MEKDVPTAVRQLDGKLLNDVASLVHMAPTENIEHNWINIQCKRKLWHLMQALWAYTIMYFLFPVSYFLYHIFYCWSMWQTQPDEHPLDYLCGTTCLYGNEANQQHAASYLGPINEYWETSEYLHVLHSGNECTWWFTSVDWKWMPDWRCTDVMMCTSSPGLWSSWRTSVYGKWMLY